MKLVIDIPEEMYKNIQSKSTEIQAEGYTVENAILNGIPLPKGHGDLIDKNKLITKAEIWDFKANGIPNYAWRCIKDAPVIIGADKENK